MCGAPLPPALRGRRRQYGGTKSKVGGRPCAVWSFAFYNRTAPPREVFDAYYALALEDPYRRLLIAWEGDEAVGFADAHQRDSLMLGKKGGCNSGFFVREDRRRRNVGTALLVTPYHAAESRRLCSHYGILPEGGWLQPGFFGKARLLKERYGFVRTMQ